MGNSWGLILPKEILELLGVEPPEVDVEVVGTTLVVSAPDVASEEIDASLAYLASKRGRAEILPAPCISSGRGSKPASSTKRPGSPSSTLGSSRWYPRGSETTSTTLSGTS